MLNNLFKFLILSSFSVFSYEFCFSMENNINYASLSNKAENDNIKELLNSSMGILQGNYFKIKYEKLIEVANRLKNVTHFKNKFIIFNYLLEFIKNFEIAYKHDQVGCLNFLNLLIASGVDLNYKSQNSNNETLLMQAIKYHAQEIVLILLKNKNVRVNEKNSEGKTALFLAIEYDNAPAFKFLLEHQLTNVFEKDKNEMSVFKFAKDKQFIDQKTDNIYQLYDEQKNKYYSTYLEALNDNFNEWQITLLLSIDKAQVELFRKMIIKLGAYFKNKEGDNILHYAILKSNSESIKFVVLTFPVLLMQKNNVQITPWHLAIQNLHITDYETNSTPLNVILDIAYKNKN